MIGWGMLAAVAAPTSLVLGTVFDFISNFEALVSIGGWAVAASVVVTARMNFRSKSFLKRVNFSLNDIRDGGLLLRTLHEASADDVFLNPAAVSKVIAAAKQAPVEQPFLSLASDDDWGYVLRSCLNVLSETNAPAYIARALGTPVALGTFVFGVTFENYGDMNTRKLRVLLIDKALLERYFVPEAPEDPMALTLAEPTHRARIDTLRVMGRLYASSDPADRRRLRDVELGVPAAV